MSGTSLDGIDAAIIKTDGVSVFERGASLSGTYDAAFRGRLRGCLGRIAADPAVEEELTRRHADQVSALLAKAGLAPLDIDVIGFHGQTINHSPEAAATLQLGDGARLARLTGIDVVNDFRSNDMAHGGQGAPLAPLYHWALARDLEKPLAVLNLGGVANVTWIGEGEPEAPGTLLAFDTGPANALLDDWVAGRRGAAMDEDGRLAASGTVNRDVLAELMDHPYFGLAPPKSLDRMDFSAAPAERLDDADGAATLLAFTAASVAAARPHLPGTPRRWLVTGGGRHNPVLMAALAEALGTAAEPVEAVGWDGDMLEAQAFAYLAVRSLRGLPLSVPGTTGVSSPVRGGVRHRAQASASSAGFSASSR